VQRWLATGYPRRRVPGPKGGPGTQPHGTQGDSATIPFGFWLYQLPLCVASATDREQRGFRRSDRRGAGEGVSLAIGGETLGS
jgi:hypothetical protein